MNIPSNPPIPVTPITIVSPAPMTPPAATGVQFQAILDHYLQGMSNAPSDLAIGKFHVLALAVNKTAAAGLITPAQEQEFLSIISARLRIGQIIGYQFSNHQFALGALDLSIHGLFANTPVEDPQPISSIGEEPPLPVPDPNSFVSPLSSTPIGAPTLDPFSIFSDTSFIETELTDAAELQIQLHAEIGNLQGVDSTHEQLGAFAAINQNYAAMLMTLQTTIGPIGLQMPPFPMVFGPHPNEGVGSLMDTDPMMIQSVNRETLHFGHDPHNPQEGTA